ncbi:hypothetical protein Ancab_023918 [Ancistrocladus abbreviatus]
MGLQQKLLSSSHWASIIEKIFIHGFLSSFDRAGRGTGGGMEEEEESNRCLESFLKWAAQLGISDSPSKQFSSQISYCDSCCLGYSLCVSYFPKAGGRGLAAARDLRKGELILRVPKSALMTRESLLGKDQQLSDAVKRYPSLSSTQILAVCLLAEMGKGRRSLWYPYLLQLPRSNETLASFGPFESKALQVDDAIWIAEKAISKEKLHWRESIALMEELSLKPQLKTFGAWLWASAIISSRTLHIPWDDAGCLCPVGDFFNYAAAGEDLCGSEYPESCNIFSLHVTSLENGGVMEDAVLSAEQYEDSSGRLTDAGYEGNVAAYCFYSKRDYRKGDQVLLSYGTYTNLELLEHYGFILKENLNDKVVIPLGPDIFASSTWPADSMYIQQNGRPSFTLLSTLRIWATPANQRKAVARFAFSGSQLSPQNEIAVMQWLASSCRTILESLPSTIEDDNLLLQAIDNIQDLQSLGEVKELPFSVSSEFDSFLESNCLRNGEGIGKLAFCRKFRRTLDKWKLAVHWRLGFKKILVDCISSCCQTMDSLSPQNVSIKDNEHLSFA